MTLVSTPITGELYVRPQRWPALAISLLLHGALTLIVAAAAHVYHYTRPEASGRFRLKMMYVREPQRLFMARMAPADRTRGEFRLPKHMAGRQAEPAAPEEAR